MMEQGLRKELKWNFVFLENPWLLMKRLGLHRLQK